MEVHGRWGPDFIESLLDAALAIDLRHRGIRFPSARREIDFAATPGL
jgi:hypothetical protein